MTDTNSPNNAMFHIVCSPDQIVVTINPNKIPETELKQFILPGRTDVEQALSGKQIHIILRHLREHEEFSSMTFASAVSKLRQQAGIRGASRDFGLVNWIMQGVFHENRHNEMSQSQDALRLNFVKILSGNAEHFHAPIQTRIEQMRREDRQTLAALRQSFMLATTQGQFSRAFDLFKALFGDIPRRGANVDLGDEQFGEIGNLDPVNNPGGDEERF